MISVLLLAGCFNRPPEHGTAFLVEANLDGQRTDSERDQVMTQILKALGTRADRLGVRSSVQRQGTNRILIKTALSSQTQLADIKRWIARQGALEFRLVHPESDELVKENSVAPGYETLTVKRRSGKPISPPADLSGRERLFICG